MNALLNLQLNFKDSLLIKDSSIEQLLNENSTSKSYSAIEIYKNAYQQRLIESLKTDYPMLERLIGTENFDDLAIEYINKHPSSSFTLRFFGQYLSTFLTRDTLYQSQPYLAEMAELEWSLVNVFDVEDIRATDVSEMNRFKPEDWPYLAVSYHPSVRWVVLHWNIVDVYQAMLSNSTVPDLELLTIAKHCLIWRKQYSSFFRQLATREWLSMKMLEQSSFAALCDTLSVLDESDENSALNAATYLKTWLTTGLIASVNTINKGSS